MSTLTLDGRDRQIGIAIGVDNATPIVNRYRFTPSLASGARACAASPARPYRRASLQHPTGDPR
jgi:hypothetical protein